MQEVFSYDVWTVILPYVGDGSLCFVANTSTTLDWVVARYADERCLSLDAVLGANISECPRRLAEVFIASVRWGAAFFDRRPLSLWPSPSNVVADVAERISHLKRLATTNPTPSFLAVVGPLFPHLTAVHITNMPTGTLDHLLPWMAPIAGQLTSLRLSGCRKLSAADLFRLLSLCQGSGCKLREVDLSFTSADDEAVKLVATEQLQSLTLSHCTRISDATTANVVKQCGEALQHIDLSGSPCVAGGALRAIAASCGNLRSLDIGMLSDVDPEAVCAIAQNCPLLERLNISRCALVNDVAVEGIVRCLGPRCLTHLRLVNCHAVTAAGIKAIALECSSITVLHFGGNGIADAAVMALLSDGGRVLRTLQSLEVTSTAVTDTSALALLDAHAMCPGVLRSVVFSCVKLSEGVRRRIDATFPGTPRPSLRTQLLNKPTPKETVQVISARSMMPSRQEEVSIAAEREELRRAKRLKPGK